MADIAWLEVNALSGNPGPVDGTITYVIEAQAVQEGTIVRFEVFDDPSDWRVSNHGVRSLLTLTNGERLFVTETYNELAVLCKLKRK